MRAADVKANLKHFSKAELVDLRNAISALLALGGGAVGASASGAKEATADHTAFMLCDMIATFMKNAGADFTSSFVLRKTPQYSSFRQKVVEDGMHDYFHKAMGNNRVRTRALMRLSVGLLYDNLLAMSLPVSSRLMLAHAHRIPSVINTAFPGYAENGMLHMVIKSEE